MTSADDDAAYDHAADGRHARTVEAMRDALAPEPALRLSTAGLALLAAAAHGPLRPGELTEEGRGQLAVLRERGIIGAAGTPAEEALPAIRAMAPSNVRLTAEIAVNTGCVTWSAWLGLERAVVAVRTDPADTELAVFIVRPGWAPAMAVRWLGVGPRPHPPAADPVTLPRDLLQRRLADRTVPVPEGATAELGALWAGPLKLWGVQAQPGDFGFLVLDAGQAGYWLVDAPSAGGTAALRAEGADDAVTLRPRSAREVWRRMMHATVSADIRRREIRSGTPAAPGTPGSTAAGLG